jgi:UDP-N-acetylmuramyl pentapeptide phosphotransferase/UDP-N-acetylglucosamine-1-phosphate transferase
MPPAELFHPALAIPGLASAGVSLLLVMTKRWHGRHSLDCCEGVQKFHSEATPRIGGIAMFLGLVVAGLLLHGQLSALLGLMLIASAPAFGSGLLEDLTKRVGVRDRLLATLCSGLLGWWFTGYALHHVGIMWIDLLLGWLPFSVAFTAFAVGGIANAVNIIDGFNGLAAGTLIICFGAFSLISLRVGDPVLAALSLVLIAVLLGFMLLNFPFGKIFMGDGGAYLMGFMLASVAVMLPMRNPDVSKWASLLVCGYPIIETLFSMGRRYWKKSNPGQPDSEHLHSLIKVKLVRRYFAHLPPAMRNAFVAPICWLFALVMPAMALVWYGDTTALMVAAAGGFMLYLLLYTVLFAMPAGSCLESGSGNQSLL